MSSNIKFIVIPSIHEPLARVELLLLYYDTYPEAVSDCANLITPYKIISVDLNKLNLNKDVT